MKVGRGVPVALGVGYALLWCGGVASYLLLGGPPAGSGWTAPAFLFLCALLTLSLTPPGWRWQLAVAGLAGMAAEYASLRWGVPFGTYAYTEVLAPSVLGVPVAIGCAWLILFAYVRQMLAWFEVRPWLRVIVGAAWMTALDLVIDPLAAGPLGYWTWGGGGWYYGVPAGNFAGWFGVSALLFLAFGRSPGKDRGATVPGVSVLLFFTLLAVGHRMAGPLLAGSILLGAHAAVFLTAKGRRRP